MIKQQVPLLVGAGVFVLALILYVSTLAPGLVFGDPAEYTFVPHIWGISHPPGYAFQTVLAGIWQRAVPIGDVAYRTNLLSAVLGAGVVTLVFASTFTLTGYTYGHMLRYVPALVAAGAAAVSTDQWQHSIHANAHITTAFLAQLAIFMLLRWWWSKSKRWLYAFCVVTGLSVTHHPLLVFGFPAYIVFITWADLSVVFQPMTQDGEQRKIMFRRPFLRISFTVLPRMIGFALVGLLVWLYLPIRATLPAPILFGPENTNTLNGFLDLTLARGLTVNLFQFGLAEQLVRARVFWSLLRLQAGVVFLLLMIVGLVSLFAEKRQRSIGVLFSLYLFVNLLFIMNSIQDVMAYLVTPFAALMILVGLGVYVLMIYAERLPTNILRREVLQGLPGVGLLLAIALRGSDLAPVVSLREFTEAEDWVESVYTRFDGEGEGAYLLGHWEHLTPLWYAQHVEERAFVQDDLTLVFVATTSDLPWVDAVNAVINEGPVYVSGYQRSLVDAGYRLHPVDSRMYEVISAPSVAEPVLGTVIGEKTNGIRLVGADVLAETVEAGAVIPVRVAYAVDAVPDDIIFPQIMIGPYQMTDTTDSHYLTPFWLPGETHAERFDARLPATAELGTYPVMVGLRNLNQNEALDFNGKAWFEVGTVTVTAPEVALATNDLLANISYQVGLKSARGFNDGQSRKAPWSEPLTAQAGDTVRVEVTWRALQSPDENWKVFVQLTDGGINVITQQDTPPIGGAFPTYLWFPKWVAGQTVVDIYQLTIPESTLPGDYQIETGMYGFNTFQRARFFNEEGDLSGDRFILGGVRVE